MMLMLAEFYCGAQMVTGVWHGKINKQKVEIKIIQNGDSLAVHLIIMNLPAIFAAIV